MLIWIRNLIFILFIGTYTKMITNENQFGAETVIEKEIQICLLPNSLENQIELTLLSAFSREYFVFPIFCYLILKTSE